VALNARWVLPFCTYLQTRFFTLKRAIPN
jgi:hypothetical protein